jgi:creatinine amidohydrolase
VTVFFSELRSPQVQEAARRNAVLLLPLGQIEEHGPHLPIHTDSLIAERVSDAAVRLLNDSFPCFIMDPVRYGYSQKVLQRWAGTFVIPQEIVIQVLKHILLSVADMGFRKIVIVSAHGNHVGLSTVVARMVADACGIGPAIYYPGKACAALLHDESKAGPNGTCHACEFETSVMLHLAPELVDMSVASDIDIIRTPKRYPESEAFISTWTMQESQTGAYGAPTKATAAFGKKLFDKMATETAAFVRYYRELPQV